MVHRDLKPANLLLHNFSIKIADLGFSKVTEDHEQMLESIVGTPLYMSPQIF
jgi:serine/threonine protein kinase